MELNLPTHLFYGGAFDPPHIAHLELLKTCGKVFPKSKIHLFVDQNPPPLGEQQKKPTDILHRKKMVKLMLSQQSDLIEIARVVDELADEKPQYAVERLRNILPSLNLGTQKSAWVFGDDQWLSFSKWKEWKAITEMVDFIVFPRKYRPQRIVDQYKKLFDAPYQSNSFAKGWATLSPLISGPPTIYYYDQKISDISSTSIRSAKAKLTGSVPRSVASYIEDNHLYNLPGAMTHD